MSYSFQVRGATKAAVKLLVAAKLVEAVAAQACHERDQAQAQAAADAFIDLVVDDETKDIAVACSGSLTGQWKDTDVVRIEGASFSVHASLLNRPTE